MLSYSDYLIVISPPAALKKDIGRYKRASANLIGHFEGMHSIAHITVTHQTRCKPYLIQPAILQMEKRLNCIPPIDLHINGFDFFNHGQTAKTIYAVIERTAKTDNWFKLLKTQMGIKIKSFVPHITIVRNIPVSSFNKLWPNFENREFTQTFNARSLNVLHRDTFSEHRRWRPYKELFFLNSLTETF